MALVDVSGVHVTAQGDGGAPSDIVRDIGFSIDRGEVLALIGESGSGKTTIALALLGYARRGCRIAGGSVRIGGEEVTAMSPVELSQLRGRRVAYVAQSAAAAFNPSLRLMDQVTEGVRMRGLMSRGAAETKDFFTAQHPDVSHRRALPPSGIGRPAAAADGGDGADDRPRAGDLR